MQLRLLFSLLCASAVAHAVRVAPMVPIMKPTPSLELREKFQEAVARGLGDTVPTNEVRVKLLSATDLFDCAGGPCIARVATLLRVDRIVVTEIDQTGKTYAIKVHVFDGEGHELGKAVEEGCDICTVREADEAVQKAAARANPIIAMAPPRPTVATAPRADEPGPDVPRETPVETPRAATRPPTTATPPPTVASATPPPATTTAPSTSEPMTPPPTEKKEEGRFPYRPVAYGSFGLAAVSLIATITFGVYASREGNPTCDLPNPKTACPNVYKGNAVPAAMFGVVTALAAGTGVLMLVLDWRAKKKAGPTVSAAPLPGGFAVGASLEF